MDKKHYLLVEATNIYASVFDTDQLSIIRGSSLMLKRAIEELPRKIGTNKIKPLSTGASSGLFELLSAEEEVKNTFNKVIRHFNDAPASQRDPDYRLFTFAVEYCQARELNEAKEKLYAKLRYNQLRRPSVAPDNRATPLDGHPECALEGIRCGTETRKILGKKGLSASVVHRFDAGRYARDELYAKECGEIALREGLIFSPQLTALAKCPKFPQLDNKIAVLYFDGNGFGKLQRKAIGDEGPHQAQRQQDFDRHVKELRCRFLKRVLWEMKALAKTPEEFRDLEPREGFKETIGGYREEEEGEEKAAKIEDFLRIETLLWGGDEMLFVVPAWLGMELLSLFYEEAGKWKIAGQSMTHAGGIVFCSAKAPIARMRQLAQQLADGIKERRGGRDHDRFDYIVLESVDYPVEASLAEFWGKRYGAFGMDRKPLFPSGRKQESPAWNQARDTLRGMLNGPLSKGQVYRIVNALAQANPGEFFDGEDLLAHPDSPWPNDSPDEANDKTADLSPFAALELRMHQVVDDRKRLAQGLNTAAEFFGIDPRDQRSRAWLWIHLAELWDYLAVAEKEPAQ